jgi:hypothetical protein
MPVPGREDGDGVETTSSDERIIKLRADARKDGDEVEAMSLDERIVKLRAGARVGRVSSFRLKAHEVAEPSGIPNTEGDYSRIDM